MTLARAGVLRPAPESRRSLQAGAVTRSPFEWPTTQLVGLSSDEGCQRSAMEARDPQPSDCRRAGVSSAQLPF